MDISVRVAGPEDAAAVGRILVASYPALMGAAYEPELLARALPMIVRPHQRLLAGGTYYLAEVAGEHAQVPPAPQAAAAPGRRGGLPIGCGGWSRERPGTSQTEPGLAHIRHFATHRDWIGRGVGRALYQRCEDDARAAGIARFECYASLNGEDFYAALGFERVARILVEMGPDVEFPSILMLREI